MRGVIFDLDGTLADTSGDLMAAANACFRELGLGDVLGPGDEAVALRGGRAMLRAGFARTGSHGEDEVERQYQPLLRHYASALAEHTVFYPGALDAVDSLRGAGFKVAVCTNKPEALARRLLQVLDAHDLFGAVYGADTLSVKKPDPRHLTETARAAGADPARILLVGDSDTDRNTARNAGVPSVLVTFGPAGGDMAALAPEALLDDYADLPALAERLLATR